MKEERSEALGGLGSAAGGLGDGSWRALLQDALPILRRARGWSQDDLATAAQLSKRTILRLEQGISRRPTPERDTLRALSRAFGFPSPEEWEGPLRDIVSVQSAAESKREVIWNAGVQEALTQCKLAHEVLRERIAHVHGADTAWCQAIADEVQGVTHALARLEERTAHVVSSGERVE